MNAEYIRIPKAEDVEERSGLTGAELLSLIESREVRAIRARPIKDDPGPLLVQWSSLADYLRRHDRTESYKYPRTFEALLLKYPNRHRADGLAGLRAIAGPYVAGEERIAIAEIESQKKVGEEVVLIYTRKSITIAVRNQ